MQMKKVFYLFSQIIFILFIDHLLYKKKKLLFSGKNIGELYLRLNKYNLLDKIKIEYDKNKFAILYYNRTNRWGLFAHYRHYIACIIHYLSLGYIPIIDLATTLNVFNGYNKCSIKKNPWEIFFNQPFGYTLENVIKKSKKFKYFECIKLYNIPLYYIFNNKVLLYFWQNIANKYIPLKNKIKKESNLIIKALFKGANNILGVLLRGTDYLTNKPRGHPIPPKIELVIKDIKNMEKKNKYKYIFLTTEDEIIRNKLNNKLGKKLKYLKYKKNINYNYNKKKKLGDYKFIKGNINYTKIYLINIIILSKCIDIISARTSGSIGAFIFSKGFRNVKVYFLGEYK